MKLIPGCFSALIDDSDILVPVTPSINPRGIVTAFGGAEDARRGDDDGLTQSGEPTAIKRNGVWQSTGVVGCALPHRSIEAATRPSPLAFPGAKIPWKTLVSFWIGDEQESLKNGQYITVPLLDNGPNVSRFPNHIADLTEGAVNALRKALNLDPMNQSMITLSFSMPLSYRIHGAAKFAL